jgi:hypothetical protein
MATRRNSLSKKFCRCIKYVRRTVKVLKNRKARGSSLQRLKESGAIAICVKSVLGSRGRTLKKFKCDSKPKVVTQPLLKK